jgi:hypothetical protein
MCWQVSVLLLGSLLFDGAPSPRTLGGGGVAVAAITAYTLLNLREQERAKLLATKKADDRA